MLNPDTVQALTAILLATDAGLHADWDRPPALLLIQERDADTPPGPPREMRAALLPLRPYDAGTGDGRRRTHLSALLEDAAAAISAGMSGGPPAAVAAAQVDVDLIVDLLTEPAPGIRLVAVGGRPQRPAA